MADTRQRILDVALELFGAKGYAGTSIADLAKRLGVSKAALYYHFAAKDEILEALVAQPMAGFQALADGASGRPLGDLLGAIVDHTAGLYRVSRLLGDDPSTGRALRERAVPQSREVNAALTAALGEGVPTARAHAAYAAVKNGTLALMAATGRAPTGRERADLIAAATAALGSGRGRGVEEGRAT
jgi:AcrR family transcriptional regulator